MTVGWTDTNAAPTNETGYRVEYRTATGAWTNGPLAGVNSTSAAVTGLTSGTFYVFRVKATHATGDSSWSAEVTATTP